MGSERYEKFSAIFILAGLASLIIAFLVLGLAPALMVDKAAPKNDLPAAVPADFADRYANAEEYRRGLKNGRDRYIAEACWHCHSQYVRPVSNETLRYGPVSQPGEYESVLHRPQLFGTRRVGPDLSRESGKRTNDWHFAHLYEPKSVEPQSVMPSYAWLFETKIVEGKTEVVPTREAVDLVAYLQWLGSPVAGRSGTTFDPDAIVMPPTE